MQAAMTKTTEKVTVADAVPDESRPEENIEEPVGEDADSGDTVDLAADDTHPDEEAEHESVPLYDDDHGDDESLTGVAWDESDEEDDEKPANAWSQILGGRR